VDSKNDWSINDPLTYMVRVPGINRRYVHADHLIADDLCGNGDTYGKSEQSLPDD